MTFFPVSLETDIFVLVLIIYIYNACIIFQKLGVVNHFPTLECLDFFLFSSTRNMMNIYVKLEFSTIEITCLSYGPSNFHLLMTLDIYC